MLLFFSWKYCLLQYNAVVYNLLTKRYIGIKTIWEKNQLKSKIFPRGIIAVNVQVLLSGLLLWPISEGKIVCINSNMIIKFYYDSSFILHISLVFVTLHVFLYQCPSLLCTPCSNDVLMQKIPILFCTRYIHESKSSA